MTRGLKVIHRITFWSPLGQSCWMVIDSISIINYCSRLSLTLFILNVLFYDAGVIADPANLIVNSYSTKAQVIGNAAEAPSALPAYKYIYI